MNDPREETLRRLAETKGLAVSVKGSRSAGQHLVEIQFVDVKVGDRVLATFYTFTQALDWVEARSG